MQAPASASRGTGQTDRQTDGRTAALLNIPCGSGGGYLFVATDAHAGACSGVSRLHLEDGAEQDVGRGRQELDLGVRVKSVQVRALGRQHLVDVGVVADVVAVGRHRERRRQVQLAVHLTRAR